MEELVVSELQQITIEIKVLKQQTAQNIIEIGKRLKQIRDDERFKGRYLEWLENEVEFTRQTASRFIQVAEQFGNGTTSYPVQPGKLFELIALPDSVDRQEFIEQPHTVPSTGETKTVDEMTVRELREVKAALKRTEEELATTQEQAESIMKRDRQLREENERLKREKNPEPQVVQVEVESPELVRKNQEMNTKIAQLSGEMETIRRDYEKRLRDVKDGDVKSNRRELNRLLSEQLKAIGWNHSSALFVYQRISGDVDATRAVRQFIQDYEEAIRSQLEDWHNTISIQGRDEVWETI